MLTLFLACTEPASEEPLPTETFVAEASSISTLTELSALAVAGSPSWVQDDLALALLLQEDWRADELASLIVDIDQPWLIDEVAFVIAHTSPEVLADELRFHPALILDNAQWIYEVDPSLDYVELVEMNQDQPDWYTTTTYTVLVEGVEEERTLERDHYYWFVVHPRVEDEHPWYIEPWERCTHSSLECYSTEDEGLFWREFLWEAARETCPVDGWCPTLDGVLPGAQFLWDGGGEGAIGDIARFMLSRDDNDTRWLSFGAHGERSIQPNRIYGLGRGNCGEWADMTTAIARTGLIPNVNVTPSSWDHTWNAFWDGRWVAWEPVNFWIDHDYNSTYATYATRGDTKVLMHSQDYAETVGELQVLVSDLDGVPVDGATVSIWSPYDSSWWYAGEGFTDLSGVASFTVGAGQEYAFRVQSVLGDYPSASNTIDLAGTVNADEITLAEVQLDQPQNFGLEVEAVGLDAPNAQGQLTITLTDTQGRGFGSSYRYDGDSSSTVTDAPELDVFVVDEENWERLQDGKSVEAIAWNELELTTKPKETWYVVVSNSRSLSTAAVGVLSATMDDSGATSEGSLRFRLHPGQHAALVISPAD